MSAPYLVVDDSLETPPYRQIVEQVRAMIERGTLQPSMPLPPVRQLAGDLGVAPNTVARAYAELQSAGWLVGDRRRGTRVSTGVPQSNRRERTQILREAIDKFVASLQHRGYTPQEISDALSGAALHRSR